jgi:hypothetical protein
MNKILTRIEQDSNQRFEQEFNKILTRFPPDLNKILTRSERNFVWIEHFKRSNCNIWIRIFI